MPRDTSTDTIAADLITAYVNVLSNLAGWGATNNPVGVAVYPGLGLPVPQEPFPSAYIYLAGQTIDYVQGTGLHRDTYNVVARIIGGPVTPTYSYVPETKVYQMLEGVVNELSYRRFLEDPTNVSPNYPEGTPFRYVATDGKLVVGPIGRIQAFGYSEQGNFVGIEVPTRIMLEINIGRLS